MGLFEEFDLFTSTLEKLDFSIANDDSQFCMSSKESGLFLR